MQEQNNNKPMPHPEITKEGCNTIKKIFGKYKKNTDNDIPEQVVSLIRRRIDENKILDELGISKNKLYRYICLWMVKNNMNVRVKHSPRKYGKNNYNKYDQKIVDIICGLDDSLNITKLCKEVGLSHQTMVKYLYRLMYLERKTIFRKYNNIKDDVLESITSLVRQGIDENTIIQTVGI